MIQPDSKYLLWKDVPEGQRITLDLYKRCQGATEEGWIKRKAKNLINGSEGCRVAVYPGISWHDSYAPCPNPVFWDELCYSHHPTKHKKPIPWWKHIKLQSPVKWGSDDTTDVPG